jgi:hypothetical protein
VRTEALSLASRVRYRSVGGDGVVVHLDRGRVLVVNEVGLRIVELLRLPISKTDIRDCLVREFDVTLEQAELDLNQFLKELDAEQVLEARVAEDPDEVSK